MAYRTLRRNRGNCSDAHAHKCKQNIDKKITRIHNEGSNNIRSYRKLKNRKSTGLNKIANKRVKYGNKDRINEQTVPYIKIL